MKTTEFWFKDAELPHPLVIAGPCSAETEEQTLEIARQLVQLGSKVSVYRAGLWKPRTRPGSFEGVGAVGLPWLRAVKQETGLLTATEVANKEHVVLALEAGIDILWIGARSTVSPFIVQEIADALRGTNIPVLVKNPVSPDLSLWIGAIERLNKAGIKKIGAVHRGFSSYIKTKYRNNPEWQLALDLQQQLPDIPLLLDPSHMGGKRSLLAGLCQTAFDLNYDGLMIETHIQPDEAWSDAQQQITPRAFERMLSQLKFRQTDSNLKEYHALLKVFRTQIDEIDSQIITALGNRMKISEKIGRLKHQNNVAILQSERWINVLRNMKQVAAEHGITESFAEEIFKAIHQASIEQQSVIKPQKK